MGVVNLTQEQSQALFNEVDYDKSNSIDIDELIYFMNKNQQGISELASQALMNALFILQIRCNRKMNITDLKDLFKTLPSNF